MRRNCLFQFAHIHRVPARLDYILHPSHESDQAQSIARGQVTRAQPAVTSDQVVISTLLLCSTLLPTVFPIMRCHPAAANLALACYAGANWLAIFVSYADVKRRHGET